MLNQVYVYGYFHADLHPANLFVLPGDAIGYVDFGIVGQLPDDVRESLTRYGWLLFRGEIEDAIGELMRWLAPTPATDVAAARRQLVRAHQAFFYDISGRGSRRPGRGRRRGRADRPADNPYSKLAVDIMKTIRDERADALAEPRRVPEDAGHARHDPPPARDRLRPGPAGPALLQPAHPPAERSRGSTRARRWTGCTPASVRLRRALEFVEFIEAQQPFIIAAPSGRCSGSAAGSVGPPPARLARDLCARRRDRRCTSSSPTPTARAASCRRGCPTRSTIRAAGRPDRDPDRARAGVRGLSRED